MHADQRRLGRIIRINSLGERTGEPSVAGPHPQREILGVSCLALSSCNPWDRPKSVLIRTNHLASASTAIASVPIGLKD
jgi:hypothetical protein